MLRDPLGFCEEPVVLSSGSIHVLRYLDGERSVRDIQAAIARATGAVVAAEKIEALIEGLDERHLLQSEAFERHRSAVAERFAASAVRPCSLAGQSYPADPDELRAQLLSFFTGAGGSGLPGERRASPVRAVVAPHIDLRNGGPCYTHAYKALVEGTAATTFVILGVAHCGAENLFVATRKAFRTPLGTATTDGGFLERLAGRLPFDLFAGELAHRNEHSIEFQVVFLQHLFGEAVRIVPILIGGFDELIGGGARPEDDARVGAFLDGMRHELAQRGDDVAVVVSVDLSHVGKRFGDAAAFDAGFLSAVEAADRGFLRAAAELNADGVLAAMASDGNARRVDGFPGIYALLNVLPLRSGELLRYEQSVDEPGQYAVSFASLAFG